MTIRTRFAPSPTGFIHLGNIRTAFYAWLFARHHGGKFILRIEDTDQERSTKEATKAILDSMEWLGLDYDEGPFYQSERLDYYREVAQKLLDAGLAYRCYCSKERLDTLREQQFKQKEKPRYDGHCREKSLPETDKPYVIRFKNPEHGTVSFDDQVRGLVTFNNEELDDLIIIRTDKYPTYNFCVVVDDLDMRISHVIRGADHVNNTPRQINIIKALNSTPPVYAHVPLILGNDGTLLSKRHGAVNVLQYRDEGFLPEAMLNYLVRLGWSHGDQEIFSREEMIKLFDVKHINKASAAFDPEKLLWLNRHYIKTLPPASIEKTLASEMRSLGIDITNGPSLIEVIEAQRERCETLCEMAAKSRIFYEDAHSFSADALTHLTNDTKPILQMAHDELTNLSEWEKEKIHGTIETIAAKFGVKLGKVAQPIRVATTYGTFSPPIDITLKLIGKKRTIERLQDAIRFIEQSASS